MIQFKENTWTEGRTDGRMDRRKDRQTALFYRTLLATAGGPKSKKDSSSFCECFSPTNTQRKSHKNLLHHIDRVTKTKTLPSVTNKIT